MADHIYLHGIQTQVPGHKIFTLEFLYLWNQLQKVLEVRDCGYFAEPDNKFYRLFVSLNILP